MVVRGDPASLRFSNHKPDGPMSDGEILAYLNRKAEHALNQEDGELSEVRERMLSRYRGDAIGTEIVGRSSFRTREIFEMVEGALPGLLSLFFSAKNPIQFEPRGPEDVEAAQQETDVIDHFVFRRSNSYLTFHEGLKSGMLDPVAYMKVHCVHVEREKHHRYAELTQAQLLHLAEGDREWQKDVRIEDLGEGRFAFEGEEIVRRPEYIIEAVPPEQVLVEQNATKLDLDEVWNNYGYIGHRTEIAFTDLVKRGYDPAELDEAGGANFDVRYNDERTNRQDREDERPDQSAETDYSTRLFTVTEAWIKADFDGTGIAQSWRVVYIGNRIFERVKVSYQPFVAMSMVPMPFKHAGLSPAETMEDLQELKTKLMRIGLDDMYRNEERRTYMDKNAITPRTRQQHADPLQSLVEVKGPPGNAVMQEQPFSQLEQTMAMLQYGDEATKRRTGMAPDVMLNPDVLRDATAHGLLGASDRSSARLMHFGRIAAETLFKKIGGKFHQLLRMYQDRAMFVEIRGEFVEVNPADWDERTEMKVAVGLGFNSKEQTLQALMQILTLQKEALAQGLATPQHLMHTLSQLVQYADIGFYTQYFVDPTQPGWQPPPPAPDPQLEAVKAQTEIAKAQEATKQQQIVVEGRTAEAKNKIEHAKVTVDAERIRADAELKRMEAKVKAALVVEKREAEIEILRAELVKMAAETAKLRAEAAAVRKDAVDNDEAED